MGVPPAVPGMPDRHSRPASLRDTAAATTSSQRSPAPTRITVVFPKARKSRPPNATCRTTPSNPASAITTLLPPPSTNSGRRLSPLHLIAAAASSADVARTNHRAGPPTPRVVNGASGTPAWGAIESAKGEDLSFGRDERGDRVGSAAHLELEPVARPELRGQRQVGAYHHGQLRIATGRLSIGHQEDRLSRRRNLHAPHEHDVGDHVAEPASRDHGLQQPVSHAV